MAMEGRWREREEERREEWMRLGVRDPHEINAIAELLDESSIKYTISYMDITIESNMLQPLLVPSGTDRPAQRGFALALNVCSFHACIAIARDKKGD
jgi:hypothetical protein